MILRHAPTRPMQRRLSLDGPRSPSHWERNFFRNCGTGIIFLARNLMIMTIPGASGSPGDVVVQETEVDT